METSSLSGTETEKQGAPSPRGLAWASLAKDVARADSVPKLLTIRVRRWRSQGSRMAQSGSSLARHGLISLGFLLRLRLAWPITVWDSSLVMSSLKSLTSLIAAIMDA